MAHRPVHRRQEQERSPHLASPVNAVIQAEQFHKAVGVTGLALTKLDGTAKGGVIFAIAKNLGLPIRLIGVGEGIDDLRDFDAEEFVDALLVKPDA